MKLADLKLPGDLSIQSYVDSLIEAANKHEDVTVVVIIARPPGELSVIHNIENEHSIPHILTQLGAQMREPKKSRSKHTASPEN